VGASDGGECLKTFKSSGERLPLDFPILEKVSTAGPLGNNLFRRHWHSGRELTMTIMRSTLQAMTLLLAVLSAQAAESAGIAVVGATPSGIAAAVAARRAGAADVVLLEASEHVGGRFAEALGFDEQNRMAAGGGWRDVERVARQD
jgi:hypothetical protein